MTTIVGIYDDSRELERAIEKLSDSGFDDRVFDQAIVAQDMHWAEPAPEIAGGVRRSSEWDAAETVRAFEDHLKDYRLPREAIEAYVMHFRHEARVVVVQCDRERAPEAIDIMNRFHASRVDRHE